MKTLYICRHAKSSWADPGMSDFDRPLNDRGRRNAPMMARIFKERGEKVDLFVTSPAVRAITTARYFIGAHGLQENELIKEPRIYEASLRTLLAIINELPPTAESVMLFGHNPGFTEVIEYLSDRQIGNLPTCGIARITFEMDDWKPVSGGTGSLDWLEVPGRQEA
jgi:phosphohistidine phosphatase